MSTLSKASTSHTTARVTRSAIDYQHRNALLPVQRAHATVDFPAQEDVHPSLTRKHSSLLINAEPRTDNYCMRDSVIFIFAHVNGSEIMGVVRHVPNGSARESSNTRSNSQRGAVYYGSWKLSLTTDPEMLFTNGLTTTKVETR